MGDTQEFLGTLDASFKTELRACLVTQKCLTICEPSWTVACWASLSTEISLGNNTGVDCYAPSPGDLPNLGIESRVSPALQADSLPSELYTGLF